MTFSSPSIQVPNLYAPEETEKIVSLVRPLAKAAGKVETREAVLQHFVQLGEDGSKKTPATGCIPPPPRKTSTELPLNIALHSPRLRPTWFAVAKLKVPEYPPEGRGWELLREGSQARGSGRG